MKPVTVFDLLNLWDQAIDSLDSAMDYQDYRLANSIEEYLYNLSFEIESFLR